MQAPFYRYNTSGGASVQSSYDSATDQGTWQQPDLGGMSSNQQQQEDAYYTGITTSAAPSYYTNQTYMPETGNGNSAAVQGTGTGFARGNQANVGKSTVNATAMSNNSNQVSQQNPNYGGGQFMATGQYQDNGMGGMAMSDGNMTNNNASFYGYNNEQYMSSSSEGMSSDLNSYNTMVMGMGNSTSNMGMDMGNNVTGGNNNGRMGMGNNNGHGNLGYNVAMDVRNSNGDMGMASNRGSTNYGTGSNNSDNKYHNNQMNTFDNHSQSNNKNGPNFRNFRQSPYPNQRDKGVDNSSESGSFHNSWANQRGFASRFPNRGGNNFFREGRRGFGRAGPFGGRGMHRDQDYYHRYESVGGRGHGSGDERPVYLNATNYNQWCYLRKSFGKRDNDLAQHLFELHKKYSQECKERLEAEKIARKGKGSEETEGDNHSQDDGEAEETLTEEELQMRKLMGFAGFGTTKGLKAKDDSFYSADRVSSTKSSKEKTVADSKASTVLSPEERQAMAALGGFSVFSKVETDDPLPVEFGAPAVTFTATDAS